MKAQSAIEYLTTYGWVLVVAAITSSVVYMTVDFECQESSSGFYGSSVYIEEIGTSEARMDAVVKNDVFEEVKIDEVKFLHDSSDQKKVYDLSENISAKGDKTISFKRSETGSCNSYDVEISFNSSNLNLTQKGSLTVSGDLSNVEGPGLGGITVSSP